MSKVTLICGRICCGKTTYAKKMCAETNAVLLSVDEIMLSLFDQCCGEKMHMEFERRIKEYLLNKSLEFIQKDIDVVLDWGFWTKHERTAVKEFFKSHDAGYEMYYIDISEEEWKRRLAKRNSAVLEGEHIAYFVDENLALKFASMFEAPGEAETDRIFKDI